MWSYTVLAAAFFFFLFFLPSLSVINMNADEKIFNTKRVSERVREG